MDIYDLSNDAAGPQGRAAYKPEGPAVPPGPEPEPETQQQARPYAPPPGMEPPEPPIGMGTQKNPKSNQTKRSRAKKWNGPALKRRNRQQTTRDERENWDEPNPEWYAGSGHNEGWVDDPEPDKKAWPPRKGAPRLAKLGVAMVLVVAVAAIGSVAMNMGEKNATDRADSGPQGSAASSQTSAQGATRDENASTRDADAQSSGVAVEVSAIKMSIDQLLASSSGAHWVPEGQRCSYALAVTYSNGRSDDGANCTVVSDDPTVLEVNEADRTLTARSPGTARLTATCGSKTQSFAVTVADVCEEYGVTLELDHASIRLDEVGRKQKVEMLLGFGSYTENLNVLCYCPIDRMKGSSGSWSYQGTKMTSTYTLERTGELQEGDTLQVIVLETDASGVPIEPYMILAWKSVPVTQ